MHLHIPSKHGPLLQLPVRKRRLAAANEPAAFPTLQARDQAQASGQGKQDAKREQGVKREQEAEEQAKRPSGLIQRRFIGTLAEGAQVGTLRGYCRLVPECRDAT
jgi:hypothetical protein